MTIENLPSLPIDMTSVGEALQQLADQPVIRLLPPLNAAIGLIKNSSSLSDRFLGMAIINFINTVSKNNFWRNQWQEKTTKSPDRCAKVGTSLLMALQRIDETEKAEIIGILFVAYAGGVITDTELIRLVQSVNTCTVDDILKLANPDSALMHSTEPWMAYLQTANLTEYVVQMIDDVGEEKHYDTTEQGRLFREAYDYGYKKLYE